MNPLRWTVLTLLLACNSLAIAESLPAKPDAPATDPNFTVDVRQAVAYLASDELEGRGIGSAGLDKAADYVADTFKKLGLQPAPGLDGYFQPFAITFYPGPDPKSALILGDKTFAVRKNFDVVPTSAEGKFDAPVVFAGYGITSKENDYDDYANLDVKGKVVLVLRYEPHDKDGVSRFTKKKDNWSRAAALYRKTKFAADNGAVAILIVTPPKFHDDVPMPFSSDDDKSAIPALIVRRPVAEELLKRAGGEKTLADLQDAIDSSGKPVAKTLDGVWVSGEVKLLKQDTPVKNVVAMAPGKGELAKEFVVVGGHYDHLGRGGSGSLKPNAKEIHNGADDNASGVATVLKLAEHYAKHGSNGRSILFVTFTAEESGLIGSDHFVSKPPVPLDKIAYMLNLDMVGRMRNHVLSIGGVGTASSLEPLVKRIDDASPVTIQFFDRGGFGPSDHSSFAKKKIPVLFFWTGVHNDYHRPSDDADKVNYEGIEQIAQFGISVLDSLDSQPREQYVSASDDPHAGMSLKSGEAPSSGEERQASLGVLPHYGEDDGRKGALIDDALPGTAAAEAGLRGGDLIVKLGETKIDSLRDLSDALKSHKPGDKVKVVVVREGKNVEMNATLRERKG